jgi:hypothetical protein
MISMSKSPKYSKADLDDIRKAIIESENRRRAEKEAKLRQMAEERERKRLLEEFRRRCLDDADEFVGVLGR